MRIATCRLTELLSTGERRLHPLKEESMKSGRGETYGIPALGRATAYGGISCCCYPKEKEKVTTAGLALLLC